MQLAEEIMRNSRVGVNAPSVGLGLTFIGHTFLSVGKRKPAEDAIGELRSIKERTGLCFLGSTTMDAILMIIDGHLEKALDAGRLILTWGEESGVSLGAKVNEGSFSYRAQIYLGKSLTDIERELRTGDRPMGDPITCLILAHLGLKDEAVEILEKTVVRRPGIGTTEDEIHIWIDTPYLEAAVITGHRRAAELLLNRFSGTGIYTSGLWHITCIPRHLGGAAALLERYDEARNHYQEAIRVCTEMRFRPELALTQLQLAELLLEQYPQEKSEAIAHLDFVIPEFRDMKMQPSLERALRHKEILKA
jgi:tetratricopeptide (TPR) repeat protein